MNGTAARFLRLGMGLSGLVVLGWVLTGQAAKPANHGIPLPTDWSHRHLIFSRPGSAEQLARVSEDPRYQQQIHRREQALMLPASMSNVSAGALLPEVSQWKRKQIKRDWAEDLGAGASVGAGNYPAKFSFQSDTANCGNATTPDYVVYGTGLAGSPTQASVVGFDNLYSGCTGTVPSVYWAYNTGGQIVTSPVLSLDGSQIAFMQTLGGVAGLVLLKWQAGDGSVGAPVTPTFAVPGLYQECPAPCMTEVPILDGGSQPLDDTTSSVYYDYTNDIAWVGGTSGWLHLISGVFKGVPIETFGGGFPARVSTTTTWISSPVYDRITNNVFVGDHDGFLYRVNATNGQVVASGKLDFGTGLVESPIVDTNRSLVYVFASSDGTALCPGGVACSAVYQLSTSFAGGTTGTKVTAGNSVILGSTPNPMYVGAFDSSYYSSTNATGNLYVCGNTGEVPSLYQIRVNAGTIGVVSKGATLATPGSTAACSPVTDVSNPNTTGGASERVFFSVQNNSPALCASASGCVFNILDTPWQPSTPYSVGQRIFSKNLHVETVLTAGTSGATTPAWTSLAASLTTDSSVVWIDEGSLNQALTNNWLPSHVYTATNTHFIDSNGNIEVSTTLGTSGLSQPVWNTAVGGTTADNTVTWTNVGAAGIAALASTGGASGIIIDNMVNGSLAGTSQIYFSTLGDQVCGTSGSGGCAVQASQPTLR